MRRTCPKGGRLVGGRLPLPTAAFDRVSVTQPPVWGCNQLACGVCGASVVSRPGYVNARHLDAAEVAQLHAAEDWEPFEVKGWLRRADGARLYVCEAHAVVIERWRDVDATNDRSLDRPLPAGWRCGGHPVPGLPLALDGETIGATTDLLALVRGVGDGSRAGERPPYLAEHPGAWLQRAHALLLDADLDIANALAVAVSDTLGDSSLDGVALAVDFFARVPLDVAAAGLEAGVSTWPEEWRDADLPFGNHEAFGQRVQDALIGLISGPAPDPSAVAAARAASDWPQWHKRQLRAALDALDPA